MQMRTRLPAGFKLQPTMSLSGSVFFQVRMWKKTARLSRTTSEETLQDDPAGTVRAKSMEI
ncbi:hypothetical protein BN871_DH_00140 [Paenibacillus sp. P22]|nr:hypothetical protein BN871_DH_00140 [Paenibacillus sp. P22]